jgi:hypothetical protein
MGQTTFNGTLSATEGFVGQSAVVSVTFTSASTDATVYTVAPVTGYVSSAYVVTDVADRASTYAVKIGSAGSTVASGTFASAGAVAGTAAALTVDTAVSVTAGQSLSVARTTVGTAGAANVVGIVIFKTA